MHCTSCEIMIGDELQKIPGVTKAKLNYKKGEAEVCYSGMCPSPAVISGAVQAAGYEVGTSAKLPWFSNNKADYADLSQAAGTLFVLYGIAQWFGIFDINVTAPQNGIWVSLLVGLVAGLSTCMALIGGLVLSLSARHAELHPEATTMQKFRPHLYFNMGRIVGFAILGGLIGFLGKAFQPSPNVLGFLTMTVGGVMIFLGLKLVEIFPVLKNRSISLPSSVARFFGIKSEVKEYSHKSATLLGALTFFLPCGFTQTMQLFAVSTGNFWSGALVMGLFAIGTAPGLLSIGGLSSAFKGRKARIFFMVAGLAVIILGWNNLRNGRQLIGGQQTAPVSKVSEVSEVTSDTQVVRMTQNANGYSPAILMVKRGRPVQWIVNSTSRFSCAASIVLPKYGISQSLNPGENIFRFTPTEIGEIPFSCSMGMYRGKFIVTE